MGGLTISRSQHPFRNSISVCFTPSSRSRSARTHQCFCVVFYCRTVRSMCITAPWQNTRAVDEAGPARAYIDEQGSRQAAATQFRGAKGQIFIVYLLGIRLSQPLSYSTSKLNLLHSNAAPTRAAPQLSVINRLQNILIYIHQRWKEYKIFYSSKSTITLLKFYLSTSKSTSLKIYSSKSKKVAHLKFTQSKKYLVTF